MIGRALFCLLILVIFLISAVYASPYKRKVKLESISLSQFPLAPAEQLSITNEFETKDASESRQNRRIQRNVPSPTPQTIPAVTLDSSTDENAESLLNISQIESDAEAAELSARRSEPFALPDSLEFPCAPPNTTSLDYKTWTDLQKLEFGVCFETNDELIEQIKNRTLQAIPEDDCEFGTISWEHIRPGGLNDIDFHNEYHEEIPIPEEFLADNMTLNARVLNYLGFDYLHHLLTSGMPVCDVLRNDHLPIRCYSKKCICKDIEINEVNDFILHYTSFRDQTKDPIRLEYNRVTKKCTFETTSQCTVQPMEGKEDGYFIPCEDDQKNCLIKGNNVLCTRKNMSKTVELYNDFATQVKSPLIPFRMYYPIDCICTDIPPREELPLHGFERDVYIQYFGLDEDYDSFDTDASGAASLKLAYFSTFTSILLTNIMLIFTAK